MKTILFIFLASSFSAPGWRTAVVHDTFDQCVEALKSTKAHLAYCKPLDQLSVYEKEIVKLTNNKE